nr:Arm DNA-binding domain-containing protein [uncultured Pedobacter sp.]
MKKQKNYQSGKAPIYLRITVDGKRCEVTTGRCCDPVQWNPTSGRCNGKKEETKSLNAYLDDLQNKVFEAHRQLTEKDDTIVYYADSRHSIPGQTVHPNFCL